MKYSPEVAQVVEDVFYLKENPRPSNLITEAGLRDSRLAPIGDP